MRIKSLAQGENILMLGLEPSTFCIQNRHSNHYTNLEVYINHLDELREDFKIRFGDLDSMCVPDWLLTPFDMKIDSKCYEFNFEKELIEMHVGLEAI